LLTARTPSAAGGLLSVIVSNAYGLTDKRGRTGRRTMLRGGAKKLQIVIS
jgi:hypothetical protein